MKAVPGHRTSHTRPRRSTNDNLALCHLNTRYSYVLYFQAELKMKVLEAKHQEEKLKMQQRHDGDIEKILARKNGEIEELKSTYLAKQKQSEETIRKLERKVQSMLRESQVITESKEKQIAELKKMADQSSDSLKNEWEKKLHAAVTEMEQEKFELQKKHTMNIQELLEETNLRLAKMEAEYSARAQSTELTVRELEKRVKKQSEEVEKGNTLRQKVTQEKAQLEIHIAAISTELQEANRRSLSLKKEDQKKLYEQSMEKLHTKYEMDISHLKHEHMLSAAKASELIGELEKTASQLRLQLQDNEHLRVKQLRDQEMKFQMEKEELQIQLEKKQERTRLQQAHIAEKDSMVQERQREVGNLERQARATLQQQQQLTQEWRKHDAQVISDLETQVTSLREELQISKFEHKQQLAEMTSQLEEDKQKALVEKEESLEQLRSVMERSHKDLERRLQREHEASLEKFHFSDTHLVKQKQKKILIF
uniref:Centrosomal protein 112 n=1 Tax=Periophthalmus magnuspinnatus TaxID=409849 RepID=A0A3B4B8P6_9GOBI